MSERRALSLLWLGTFLLLASVAHGNLESTDAGFTMHAARALWRRGDSGLLTREQGGELIGEQLGAADIATSERSGNRRHGKLGRNGRAYVWFPFGHVVLLVPFVALGDLLAAAAPDADPRFERRVGPSLASWVEGSPVLTQGLIALLLPPACLATAVLLLYRIARLLGGSSREAVSTALAIAFASQAFALGREQLSDGPGLALLLAAFVPVIALYRGCGGRAAAAAAGFWSGAAVLVRYQAALAVAAFAVVIAVAARRRGRCVDLWIFAAAGAPFLGLLLAVNQARFGDWFETGYPRVADWFRAEPLAGLAKLLFGAGRGAMFCSPLLWLALPLALRPGRLPLRWLGLLLFAAQLLLFATALGWQSGQCWAVRYVTPGIVVLLAIVLPQTRPWLTRPRTWTALCAAGVLVSLTSVVAPVRGVQQLAAQAVRAEEASAAAAGRPGAAPVDPADRAGWHWRYTPLLANWRYLLRSRQPIWEDERELPRHGGPATIEALFGIAAVAPDHGHAPMRWEDRSGRHLWWRFWGDLYGVSLWPVALLMLAAGAAATAFGRRHLAASTFSTSG